MLRHGQRRAEPVRDQAHRLPGGAARASFPSATEAIARVRRHAEHLARGVLENPLLDVAGARRIADALIAALGRAAGLDRYRLAWLLSATAYFCEHSDRYHDVQDLIGLEDDAFVVSAVLDHCGMHALARSIRGGGS